MFLQRRDTERQLPSTSTRMDYDDKLHLLQDLAYWMMMNGLTTAERGRVTELVQTRLAPRRHRITGTTHEVFEYLLERSGVIREPVVGRIDFIHRSFQEYLAAQAAVDRDDIEVLIERAADEQWRQVVIVAAGLGNQRQTKRIFEKLLNPPRKLREHRLALERTALGCLETATEVDPVVAAQIKEGAGALIPPRTSEHVYALSRVGEHALDLLADVQIDDTVSLLCMTQVATTLGGSLGLKLLETISDGLSPKLDGAAFTETLIRLWPQFDTLEFADRVLARRDLPVFTVRDANMVPGLSRVPSINKLICRLGPDYTDYSFLAAMPRLSQAVIPVYPGDQELVLAFPHRACEVKLEKPQHTANPYTSAYRSGRTLVLSGLSATQTLRNLTLRDELDNIVVETDYDIEDLQGLQLPPSATGLKLIGCPSLSGLNGAQDLAGSRLKSLEVELTRLEGAFEAAVAPLLETGPDRHTPLIEQLGYVNIFSSRLRFTSAEIRPFAKRLAELGFQRENSNTFQGIAARR
jgi:hypothetical protein